MMKLKDNMPRRSDIAYFVTGIALYPLKSCHEWYIEWKIHFKEMTLETLELNTETFLWLPTYKQAENFVLRGCGGISEGGSNKWVCIEDLKPQYLILHPTPQVFFEYVGDWETNGHYEKLDGWPKQLDDYYKNNHLIRRLATIG